MHGNENRVGAKYEDFARARTELAEILARMAAGFQTLEAHKRAESLSVTRESLIDDAFRVLVLGEFSRGKSTLINSLLGAQVLPAKVAPCTAVITRLRFGERKQAVLRFRDGREEVIDLVAMPDELKRRITIIDQERSPIEYCEVFYPLPLLRNGVELVDSPGLNESETRSDITRAFFDRTDAMIFVLNCEHAFSASERSFLENELRDRDLRDVFFLWNRFDAIRDSPEDFEDISRLSKEKLESRVAGRPRVFFVSARDALKARLSSNPSLLDYSNIPPFEAALEEFLAKERGRVKLRGPLKIAQNAIQEGLEKLIPHREALIRKPVDELRRIFEQQKPRVDAAERQQQRILRTIDKRGESIERETRSLIRLLNSELQAGLSRLAGGIEVGMWEAMTKQSAARDRIVQQLSNWVTEQTRTWEREQFTPVFEGAFVDLENDLNDEVGELLTNLDQLMLEIDSDNPANNAQNGALIRLIQGEADSGFGGAIKQVLTGPASKGATAGLVGLVGVGLVVLHLPVVAVGAAVLAIASGRTLYRGRQLTGEIKNAAIESILAEIETQQSAMENAALRRIEAIMSKVRSEVGTKMSIRVDEVRGQVESVIRDKERHESEAETQLQKLSEAKLVFEQVNRDLTEISARYAAD
jgi:GTPase SAR1 family protein